MMAVPATRDEILKELDAALERGLADAEAGRTIPLDEAFKRLRKELGLNENSSDQ